MASKKKIYEPLTGEHVDRSLILCGKIVEHLKQFQEEIFYKDSNQLFQDSYVTTLLTIAENIDELNYQIRVLVKPKDIYYGALRAALATINSTPNSLIITAHYLAPKYRYKRLLNRNSFGIELNQILKKINLTEQILERVSTGNHFKKRILKPYVGF